MSVQESPLKRKGTPLPDANPNKRPYSFSGEEIASDIRVDYRSYRCSSCGTLKRYVQKHTISKQIYCMQCISDVVYQCHTKENRNDLINKDPLTIQRGMMVKGLPVIEQFRNLENDEIERIEKAQYKAFKVLDLSLDQEKDTYPDLIIQNPSEPGSKKFVCDVCGKIPVCLENAPAIKTMMNCEHDIAMLVFHYQECTLGSYICEEPECGSKAYPPENAEIHQCMHEAMKSIRSMLPIQEYNDDKSAVHHYNIRLRAAMLPEIV